MENGKATVVWVILWKLRRFKTLICRSLEFRKSPVMGHKALLQSILLVAINTCIELNSRSKRLRSVLYWKMQYCISLWRYSSIQLWSRQPSLILIKNKVPDGLISIFLLRAHRPTVWYSNLTMSIQSESRTAWCTLNTLWASSMRAN